MSKIEAIFTQRAHHTVDLQFNLAEQLGEYEWELNTETNQIRFTLDNGENLVSQVQYLFSYSQVSDSIKWSWAQKKWLGLKPRFNDDSLTCIKEIQSFATANDLSEFNKSTFPLEYLVFSPKVSKEDYAFFCSSLAKRPYFMCPYTKGELYVLLENESFNSLQPQSERTVVERFRQFVCFVSFEDQLTVFKRYLELHKINYTEASGTIRTENNVAHFEKRILKKFT